jgi:hypothetical protein
VNYFEDLVSGYQTLDSASSGRPSCGTISQASSHTCWAVNAKSAKEELSVILVNARMNDPAGEILFSGEVLCSSMTRPLGNTVDPVAGPVTATFLWSTLSALHTGTRCPATARELQRRHQRPHARQKNVWLLINIKLGSFFLFPRSIW